MKLGDHVRPRHARPGLLRRAAASPGRTLRLVAIPLVLLLAVATVGPAWSKSRSSGTRLLVSGRPDRADAVPLGGSLAGPLYVFVVDRGTVLEVAFLVDGALQRIERYRPYDLAGTAADGTARPWQPLAGNHTVTARVQLDGGARTVSASFTALTSPSAVQPSPTTTTTSTTTTTTLAPATTAATTTTQPATPCDGVRLAPGAALQAALDAGGSGAAFCLQAGVYRLGAPLVPKAGQRLIGAAGAVLNGARVVSGFTRATAGWTARAPLPRYPTRRGSCQPGYTGCQLAEATFLDGHPLWRVTSLSQLRPGSFYQDYTAGTVWLADDPTGHTVEVATAKTAISSSAPGVVVQGLVIEKFANDAQEGTVVAYGSGWVIKENEVRFNHACGIKFSGAQVLGNSVHHNGQEGLCGGGSRSLVSGNDIAFNNVAGFDVGWEAGGAKFCWTSQLTVRGNRVHDNAGTGLWTDCDNTATLYQDNTIVDNDGPGIHHEISCDAVIRGNTIARNGFKDPTGWVDGAGVLISSSPDVEIDHNLIDRNYNGISLRQDDRGTGLHCPRIVQNVKVHDNQVVMARGSSGLSLTSGDTSWFTARGNHFSGNDYTLIDGTQRFAWMGQILDPSRWRAYGQDTDGTFRSG
jgi:Right handed beta helix region